MRNPVDQHPVALPARMSLAEDALANLDVAVLWFPYSKAVVQFRADMEQVLSHGKKKEVSPPYRQLNNALLACFPTLTHGFEYLGQEKEDQRIARYRALAVGTAENPLRTPSTQLLHELIVIWARDWSERYCGKGNQEADSVCDRFLSDIQAMPAAWRWEPVSPEALVQDINAENALGFQAIPSLLATMLHEKKCTINGGHGEQELRWRKAQGGGSGRTGLFVVSNPFEASYIDQYGHFQRGYFAYRLDFHLETQAGRFYRTGKLKPWVFIHLSCQRYGHERLTEFNFGRDISVLIGMNEERLPFAPQDTTLVRLVVEKNKGEFAWKLQLPKLLAAFNARKLENPAAILDHPAAFGNLHQSSGSKKDEYYLVHAEGYEYGDEKSSGHAIKTGYSLRERGDVIASVLKDLQGVLVPDIPMERDFPAPNGAKTPIAMRDFEHISKLPAFSVQQQGRLGPGGMDQRVRERLRERQSLVAEAIRRALRGEPMHLFVFWREADTLQAVEEQLRHAFRLTKEEALPSGITSIWIDNPTLLQPLDTEQLSPASGRSFDDQLRKQHIKKREDWRSFLQRVVPPRSGISFAMIEIGRSKQKGVYPQQSIYGAVRDACALESIPSQMLQTVTRTAKNQEEAEGGQAEETFSSKTKGRVLNAVLDLSLRQMGALYGEPHKIYEWAQLPAPISQELDVIAFCRVRKNIAFNDTLAGDVHYALAVRLRATGEVDVLLPGAQKWISYAQAGPEVGRLCSRSRSDQFQGNRRLGQRDPSGQLFSKIKLTGTQMAQFVRETLTQHIEERPTLALIEADGWRNERGEDDKGMVWPQLKNEHLWGKRDMLYFKHLPSGCEYQRDDEPLQNLLAVIRLRTGKETPQYITNRTAWTEDRVARDFIRLSGFYDTTVQTMLHYFSVGRRPLTQKSQDTATAQELYMLDHHLKGSPKFDEYGANIAFKHQQMVEMVPFFVHPDFQTEDGLKMLCRIPHYLRSSPAWTMGNITLPYPMHLGEKLIEDQLCILGFNA